MSTTVNMWLGIAFQVLAIVAVILQGWLWSFPMEPPNDPRGRSLAPRSWTNVHRAIGLLYVVIYVLLMTQMVPRLWRYQVELPARTVVHAVMGLTIGVLLLTKFSIIRFFRHFGKALPSIGFGLMLCTVILTSLSIPFAVQAHGLGRHVIEKENRGRVAGALGTLEWPAGTDVAALTTEDALLRGQRVLVGKCTMCHDMRTVLMRPRSAKGWRDVVERMAEKPSFGRPIDADDIPLVTAYLVALSPDLQQSMERKKDDAEEKQKVVAEMKSADPSPAAAPPIDLAKAKREFESQCSQCHKLTKVEKAGRKDAEEWKKIVSRMVEENDAELDAEQVRAITAYLAATHGK